MANQLDKFDQNVKDSLDQFEAPYNSEHWDELEVHLAAAAPAVSKYFSAITTGIAVTGVVFMSVMFMVSNTGENGPDVIASHEEVIENGDNGDSSNITHKEEALWVPQNEEAEEEISLNEPPKENLDSNEGLDKSSGNVKSASSKSISSKKKSSNTDKTSTTTEIIASSENVENSNSGPNITTGCTGLTIDFNGSEIYGKNAKYLWNFGDGFFSNESDPSHTFTKEGTFDVSLSVTSEETGQINSNVVQTMIEIVEAPLANIEIDISSGEKLILSNNSYNTNTVSWKIDGKVSGTRNETELTIADNTRYEVEFTAENKAGCADTVHKYVNISPAGSQFPKAFDMAYSNSFAPGAIIDRGTARSLKIYSPEGIQIFESSGSKGWNGALESGENASKGTYTWLMVVENEEIIDIVKGSLEVR